MQKGAWDSQAASSCYGSMVASTSDDQMQSGGEFIEAPAFFYDMDFDLRAMKDALKTADFLQDSGYHSVMERSQHTQFGTGWMVAEQLSEDADDDWDGFMTVGSDKLKIKDMSDILASRYAFLSGAKTDDGLSIVTFPDSRTQLSQDDYNSLITYLLQVPMLEDSHKGFVVIVDRRNDKWAAVRTLFIQLQTYFPGHLHVLLLVKPEGVLQRALEVGYRSVLDVVQFKVIVLESSLELRRFFRGEALTMDLGGLIKYNHLEWVQHRMDIERMKSSAAVIAQSLSDFGRCLRETELPNDVDTTARILEIQTAEKDAIKEDFRISIRKGLSLLRSVRQIESKPRHEQLSPTRLHNVTAIERMLVQLEDTEKSFDAFWERHESRLMHCLQLRRFEESFRRLQSAFAKHMVHLEEHREVGDKVERAKELAEQHDEYMKEAMEDVSSARDLRRTGEELMTATEVEVAGSLLPKCDELARMADALEGALQRRGQVLQLSQQMHTQICKANAWCRRGVDLLSSLPLDPAPAAAHAGLATMDEFLKEGSELQLDTLSPSPTMNSLILLTTTETSTLLAQVAERIDDIRRMSVARRDALQKMHAPKKTQVVSPEKKKRETIEDMEEAEQKSLDCCSPDPSPSNEPQSTHSLSIEHFVLQELLSTERSYVSELRSLIEHYVEPFEAADCQPAIPREIRGRGELVFGNLRDLLSLHSRLLPEMEAVIEDPAEVCRCLVAYRQQFVSLYHTYCQNKPTSEQIRKEYGDASSFFSDCQRRAGHPLPLGAYLLKPVQRVTKYQLLLRELERHCRPEVRPSVSSALSTMLDVLSQINAACHQLHISGFNGDLRLMGPLLLQTECDVYAYSRKKQRKTARAQRRQLFLFDGGVLFCKRRSTSTASLEPDHYEHKMCIPAPSLGFNDASRTSPLRFELWDETRAEVFACEPLDQTHRQRWSERLSGCAHVERQRPQSWASTVSTDSSSSAGSGSRVSDDSVSSLDPNGNTAQSPVAVQSTDRPASTHSDDHVVPFSLIAPILDTPASEEVHT